MKLFLTALAFLDAAARCGGPEVERSPVHRVVTFNIRYGSADDGPDRWSVRRDGVIEVLDDLGADVVGLQEAESFQVRELLAALPRYAAAGVHRDDGVLAG